MRSCAFLHGSRWGGFAAALVALNCVLAVLARATDVSGILAADTRWTAAGSPYVVTGDVTVPSGVTLTIDPETIVQFNGAYRITVSGAVVTSSTGTASKFVSSTDGVSSGATVLEFKGANLDDSQLNNLTIADAAVGLVISSGATCTGTLRCDRVTFRRSGIRVEAASSSTRLSLSACPIISGQLTQTSGGAPVDLDRGDLTECTVNIGPATSVNLVGTMVNNVVFSLGGSASRLTVNGGSMANAHFTEAGSGASSISVQGCDFYYPQFELPNTECDISDSSISYLNASTVKIQFSSGTVTSTEFSCGNNPGTALEFCQGAAKGNVTVKGCTFSNCQEGVRLTGSNASAVYTIETLNAFVGVSGYCLENRTTNTVAASGNFWGGGGTNGVAGSIYDQNDDPSVGLVLVNSTLPDRPHAPGFTMHPASKSANLGGAALFSAEVNGSPLPTLQWYKDGVEIAGAVSKDLAINPVTLASAGTYTLVASNVLGTATSNPAVLSVTQPTGFPSITTQPESITVIAGESVNLTVVATGTPTLSYQWRKDGTDIPGAASSTLAIPSVQPSDAGNYSVVVTNGLGSITSIAATLTVRSAVGSPSITSQPVGQTVAIGGTATFSVAATGTPAPTYQWTKGGMLLPGETQSTLTISNVRLSDAGDYKVIVTNSQGTVNSAAATLTVVESSQAPTITRQPSSQTVTAGFSVTFTVVATGVPTPTYQWFKNGALIAGATSSDFSIQTCQSTDAGTYTVVVSNASGSATSGDAVLTVTTQASAPIFVRHPAGQSVTAGASVTLAALAEANPSPTYQWVKDGQAIAGATSSNYTITAATEADSGDYAVYASNSAGSATSSVARITVVTKSDSATSILSNISTRARVGTGDDVMIAGFIVSGTGPKTLLIRASGPALKKFNLSGVLEDPVLELHDSRDVIATNDNWGEDSAQVLSVLQAFKQTNAFSWELGSKDAALLVNAEPGAYTAIVRGRNDATGVSLVEVYDVNTSTGASKLVNLSTRSSVGVSENVQIAGFIISGPNAKKVIIRGSGPALKKYGVSGALEDPVLELHSTTGTLAVNDDWDASVRPDFQRLGIDNWETGSKDCALVMSLNPGAYTAIVSGKNGTTGVALIEVFEAD